MVVIEEELPYIARPWLSSPANQVKAGGGARESGEKASFFRMLRNFNLGNFFAHSPNISSSFIND